MNLSMSFARTNTSRKDMCLLAMGSMLLVTFFWTVVEMTGGLLLWSYSPVQTVWSRYLVHLLLMAAVFGPRRRGGLVRTASVGMQIRRSMLMLSMPLCFVAGAVLLPLNVVWLVFWSTVLMQLLFAVLLLHERVTPGLWVASFAGWLGVWLMTGMSVPPLDWRLAPALGMAASYALYAVMTRRMRYERSCVNLFHTAFWVFLALSPFVPICWKVPTPRVIAAYAVIGLSGYLCLYFLDKTMEMAPAALTAPFMFTVPLWSGALEYLIHHKVPTALTCLGAIVVAAAPLYVALTESVGRRRLVH